MSRASIVSLLAILLISVYSYHVTTGIIASNQSTSVSFNMGTTYHNLAYCNSQQMDLYVPSTAVPLLPLVIYVHGGGLTSGDKSQINPTFLKALASAGYIVASVNYRLAPQFKYPSQLEDLECAVEYLRANASTYGINSSEIGAFGDSSGGQLVSLLALVGSLCSTRCPVSGTSPIQAAVDMFGPTNLTEVTASSDSSVQSVYGNESNLALASPSNYVSRNAPPILIIQGINDTNVPESQSIQFYNQLSALGASTKLILIQNSGHEFSQVGPNPLNPGVPVIAQDMVSFFNRNLKGQVN